MEILYRGKPYIKEETDKIVRLTSVEKRNGRNIILEFTKDQEQSAKAVKSCEDVVRKSIIDNHAKGVS